MTATEVIDLDGGSFGFAKPYEFGQWILAIVGLLLLVVGVVVAILLPDTPVLFIAVIGCLLLAIGLPTTLNAKLHELRSKMRPAEVAHQKEVGGTELVSFWNDATIDRPRVDERSWVFPPPTEDKWNAEDRYAPDAGEEPIPEHPNKVGTPRPATFSTFGLFTLLGFVLLIWQWANFRSMQNSASSATTAGDEMIPYGTMTYIIIGVTVFWLGISIFQWKRTQAMQDMPTSYIRSMAVGPTELVGQSRAWIELPETVVVDADPSKSVDDLVVWKWTYEVYVCTTRTSTDNEGNTQTKETCDWKQIRKEKGSTPFVIHDGTGGALLYPHTFKRQGFGSHLIQWECRHDLRMTSLFLNLWMDGDIRKHRWTLYGIRMGDPVYVMGDVMNRAADSMQSEDIDRTLQNALLDVRGKDAPGFKARIERGSELTALGNARSQLEYLILPLLSMVTALALLAF
jgi:hypothetical protein